MRKSRMIGLALLAGLVVAGGTAFTASNTFTNSTDIAGYGTNTVTGATITAVSYTPLSTNVSELSSVLLTLGTDVTGDTVGLQLLNSSGGLVGASPYTCTLGTWSAISDTMTATCATSDNPAIASVASIGVVAHQ
jgi:hypothetical protein